MATQQRDMIFQIRRKACQTFFKLAETYTSEFLPYFDSLLQHFQTWINQKDAGLTEQAYLLDFLVLVGMFKDSSHSSLD